jgi:hypothetical protein
VFITLASMPPALALEHDPKDASAPPAAQRASRLEPSEGGDALVCRACRSVVTTAGARASLFGSHIHDRLNPAGFVFRIGCFHRAPGAIAIGAPSADFSWFPPHLWQVALCRACLEHLGWFFSGPSTFSALILDKLLQEGGEAPRN